MEGVRMTTVEKETLESILDDLRRISSNLEEVLDNVENTSIVQEENVNYEQKKGEQISIILKELGIAPNIKGYTYLKSAILYVFEQDDKLNLLMTKNVYPKIAKIYNTTPQRVERAIRHAIESAWNKGNLDTLEKYFYSCTSPKRGKPTNSEFIYTIVDYINSKKELQ